MPEFDTCHTVRVATERGRLTATTCEEAGGSAAIRFAAPDDSRGNLDEIQLTEVRAIIDRLARILENPLDQ